MKINISILLLFLTYTSVILKDITLSSNSIYEIISTLMAIIIIISTTMYLLSNINLNYNKYLASNKLIFIYFVSLFIVNIFFQPLNPNNIVRLCAYSIVGISAYSIIPYYLFINPKLKLSFFRIIIYYTLLVSITTFWPMIIGNNFFGIPINIKEGYTFLGIQANSGILSHPLTTGTQLILGMACSFYLYNNKRSGLYLVYMIIMFLALMITQARGGIFGLFIGIVVFMSPRKLISSKVLGPLFIALLIPLVFLILVPIFKNIEILNDLLRLKSNIYSYRDILWLYGFQLIAENPWTGYGFLTSSTILGESGILNSIPSLDVGAPFHSTFIDNAVDSGIIITGIYLMLFLIPINRLGKYSLNKKEGGILLAACWAILFSAIFINYNIGGVRSVSFTIAILLGLSNYSILNKYRLGV